MDQAISQDTLKKRRLQKILLLAVIAVSVTGAAWAVNRIISPGVSLGEIRVGQVRMGAIDNTINAAGIVIPVHEEQLSSPNQSRISKVIAKAGQTVHVGELLMVLDDHTIRLAIDNLREQISQQDVKGQLLAMEMESSLKKIASEIELLELDLQSNKVKLAR